MATTEPTTTSSTIPGPVGSRAGWVFLSLARIAVGFIFLWAFLDKLLGLGFSTCRTTADDGSYTIDAMCDAAWVNGGAVTEGYLVYGGNVNSPFHDFFVNLGAERWTDWPFMIGLAGIGLALMLGIGTRVAMWTGALMLTFMYMTQMLPSSNPFLDEHIVYILVLFAAVQLEVRYQAIGLGEGWKRLEIVQRQRWLI